MNRHQLWFVQEWQAVLEGGELHEKGSIGQKLALLTDVYLEEKQVFWYLSDSRWYCGHSSGYTGWGGRVGVISLNVYISKRWLSGAWEDSSVWRKIYISKGEKRICSCKLSKAAASGEGLGSCMFITGFWLDKQQLSWPPWAFSGRGSRGPGLSWGRCAELLETEVD